MFKSNHWIYRLLVYLHIDLSFVFSFLFNSICLIIFIFTFLEISIGTYISFYLYLQPRDCRPHWELSISGIYSVSGCYPQDGLFEHEMTLKPVNQTCCTANSQSNCKSFNKNEPCGSRFGTAIAAVPDLNLDGFNDIVIGSPLENDHRGAVYIYHGSQKSIKEKYVQVRNLDSISSGL